MPAKMIDFRPVGYYHNEPVKITGRFTGAGAAVPTAVANVPSAGANVITLTRSGVGTLSAVLVDTVGFIQNYDFWVASTNAKSVQYTVNTTTFTFSLQVSWNVNAVAVDLTAAEELVFEISKSESSRP